MFSFSVSLTELHSQSAIQKMQQAGFQLIYTSLATSSTTFPHSVSTSLTISMLHTAIRFTTICTNNKTSKSFIIWTKRNPHSSLRVRWFILSKVVSVDTAWKYSSRSDISTTLNNAPRLEKHRTSSIFAHAIQLIHQGIQTIIISDDALSEEPTRQFTYWIHSNRTRCTWLLMYCITLYINSPFIRVLIFQATLFAYKRVALMFPKMFYLVNLEGKKREILRWIYLAWVRMLGK